MITNIQFAKPVTPENVTNHENYNKHFFETTIGKTAKIAAIIFTLGIAYPFISSKLNHHHKLEANRISKMMPAPTDFPSLLKRTDSEETVPTRPASPDLNPLEELPLGESVSPSPLSDISASDSEQEFQFSGQNYRISKNLPKKIHHFSISDRTRNPYEAIDGIRELTQNLGIGTHYAKADFSNKTPLGSNVLTVVWQLTISESDFKHKKAPTTDDQGITTVRVRADHKKYEVMITPLGFEAA
ncbi:hypothetical protein N9Y92_02265 [Chlamydiales bacterium]|nr:hypothetical protein [Chlamydiales bacterium]